MSADLIEMERHILGALIEHPDMIGQTFDRVPPEEWTGPHALVASILQAMNDGQEKITSGTLLDRLRRAGLLVRVGGGGMLHTLVAAHGGPDEAAFLTDSLEVEVKRRQGLSVMTRGHQMLESIVADPEEIIYEIKQRLEQIGGSTAAVLTQGWPESDVDPAPTWVIPGLLASDERVMLTGGEGLGKTMLIRQLLSGGAVGRDPFTFTEFDPITVLHVDLENPQWISDAGYRLIRNQLLRARVDIPDGTLHRIAPRMWDACNSRDVAWLMRVVRTVQPKLIAIGPLKNMSSENLNEDGPAVRVQQVLNRVRAESGAALIVEAHAGHATRNADTQYPFRPRGNSSFMAWPEFGLGLKPLGDRIHRRAELVRWRGFRTERYWPTYLTAGEPWPWVIDLREEVNA